MNKQTLKEMFNFTKSKKETIIIGFILILELIIYELSYPFIMQTVIDKAIPEGNMKLVITLSIFLIIIVVVRFFIDRYINIKRKYCYYSNNKEIKNKIFKSIQEAKVNEQEKVRAGNLFEIVGPQSYEASQLFVWNFVGIISVRLALTVTISIILLILNFKLGIIILTIFALSYIILTPFYFRTAKIYKNLQKIVIDLQGNINEYIESYGTTKTLKLEEINLTQINKTLNKCKKEIIKSNKIIAMHNGLFSLLTFASVITILIIGGNELSLGIGMASTIMLMVDYADDINRHMQSLLEHVHNLNNRYNCFLNVLRVYKMPKEQNEGTKSLDSIREIEFKDVSLSYDRVNTILDKINFTVQKPMQIAIVGKSGTGKTTLVNLLPRFYDICNGSILINDIDYREYKLEELRDNIAYVFQEPVIFEKTILENIKFGNKSNISEKKIKQVCKKIGLDEKINKLPKGYNTIINAKTDLLSYGEKQLLSFARAILKDADLIILDEVTSNLDLEFEEYIMNATKEILGGKIAFVIAHRLNTIKNSDLILFLEDKKIVEAGTHDELMERKGKYYQLYSSKEK
ncbi:MAG: ABC transporter ATP-binding protein [Clostridia bacterium]|nr:ABC transporter ATP-binding protein [Clostridia bacterium]